MCMPNYFSSSLKKYIYHKVSWVPPFSIKGIMSSIHLFWVMYGGFWFLLQSLQLRELYSKMPNAGGTACSRGQRAVTAPWTRSLWEAGSLGRDERHFHGQALILQTTAASAGSSRNKVSKCWGLEPFPGCCRVNLHPRDSLVPAGVLRPHIPGGTPCCSHLYITVRECSHRLGRYCSEITQSLVFAALFLQAMAMVAVSSGSCSRVPLV